MVPNAWNLARLSDSDSKTDDEESYLERMDDQGFTVGLSKAFLSHWNNRRSEISQNSSLNDEEEAAIIAVLDEYDNSR